ncbi:uncharacterized protein [Diabrotica undecimpunctata]|uniref:uncharacterized protein isoform X5 n=1 Tax=Diabrotica undecimpunctata TaxID=50387 RepID=UPI003B631F02
MIKRQLLYGVKNVVLVLVYLTLTMMNPASTAPAHDEVQEDKWWEKPCGSVEPSDPLPTSPPEIFFKWHLSDLLVQAEYNLIQANHLKDSFAFYTVSKGFGHPSVTTTEYPWLKSSFNVRLIQGIHTGREIMRDLYRSAQAVGYAIHVMENLNEDDQIGDVFTEMKHFHKLLLAEMCDYLDLRKMEPYPYVHLDEPVEWKEPKYKSYKPLWNSTVFRACMDFYWFLWEYLRFHRQTCWEVHNEELRATPSQVDYESYITQKVKELQGL